MVNLLFVEEIDNRLIEVFFKLSAYIPMAVRQFCREIFDGIEEIFGVLQFLYEIVQPNRTRGGDFCELIRNE